MKRAALCLVAALPLAACGHTKTTEKSPVEERTPPTDESTKSPPAHPHKMPVVESPNDLLAPGGEAEIRKKLVEGGYLDDSGAKSLEGGLRKFQAAKDLPATGVPDHETVRRLGLDPNEVFRRAQPKTDDKTQDKANGKTDAKP